MQLTFIVHWDLYFGPDDIVSLLQTVSGDRCPLTTGVNEEVVVVSEPFDYLACMDAGSKHTRKLSPGVGHLTNNLRNVT